MNVVRIDPSTKSLNKNVESYFVLLANEILRMKISPKKYRQHYHIYILLADQWSGITFGRLPSFPRRIILPLGRQGDCVFARPVILISGLAVDEGNGDYGDDDEDLPSILSATTPSLATARTEMQRALSWDRHELSRMILMMNNNWWLMIIHIFYTSMWRTVILIVKKKDEPASPRHGGQCDGCSDNTRCRCPVLPKPADYQHHHDYQDYDDKNYTDCFKWFPQKSKGVKEVVSSP